MTEIPPPTKDSRREQVDEETMEKVMRLRAETCIHGCYYIDTNRVCDAPAEDGIPNCKREIELLRKMFIDAQEAHHAAENKRLADKLRFPLNHILTTRDNTPDGDCDCAEAVEEVIAELNQPTQEGADSSDKGTESK